jgi:hypothetical protein
MGICSSAVHNGFAMGSSICAAELFRPEQTGEGRIGPGEIVPLHTHRWPGVLHLQSWSAHARRDAGGTVILDSREAGSSPKVLSVVWSSG